MPARRRRWLIGSLLPLLWICISPAGAVDPDLPSWLAVPAYEVPLEADADLDPAIPDPRAVLGSPVGSRPASGAEIRACVERIAAASNRVRFEEIGSSHEGRPLY
ncbi:MAG: hypothetical protein GF346_01890, partial [Candidatus Eisenbacteria bacterium]|nr:hypothetical protein [Candidatus Latescibacterota bacterium]MBD3301182.1 hypothetical protein [Candidatus Eisenbacteria bacterium]